MKITLLAVGKTNDKAIQELIERYITRLKHYAKFEIKTLPDVKVGKNTPTLQAKEMEGRKILENVSTSDLVILLDERGMELSSTQFAEMLQKHFATSPRDMVFVIGGPYGFSQDVYERADKKLSLSRMTLTHEMVRLFFTEQLYRAFTIIKGENYHHD